MQLTTGSVSARTAFQLAEISHSLARQPAADLGAVFDQTTAISVQELFEAGTVERPDDGISAVSPPDADEATKVA
jgi:hypothetical protein